MPSAWEGQSVKITEQRESVFITASQIMYLWRLLAFLSPASSKRKGVGTGVKILVTLWQWVELNWQTETMQAPRVSVCHTFFSQGFSGDVCITEFQEHTAVHNRPVSPHYKGDFDYHLPECMQYPFQGLRTICNSWKCLESVMCTSHHTYQSGGKQAYCACRSFKVG